MIKKGQIYFADLTMTVGSEQGGMRPVCIVSNNKGNEVSPVVIVAPITSATHKHRLPTQLLLTPNRLNGLRANSMIMCEQLRTIDKSRLKYHIGELMATERDELNKAIRASFEV